MEHHRQGKSPNLSTDEKTRTPAKPREIPKKAKANAHQREQSHEVLRKQLSQSKMLQSMVRNNSSKVNLTAHKPLNDIRLTSLIVVRDLGAGGFGTVQLVRFIDPNLATSCQIP
jgi:hypothetical protein